MMRNNHFVSFDATGGSAIIDEQQLLHEQLTYFILFISPFILCYSLMYQPTTYGKLHYSNTDNNKTENNAATSSDQNFKKKKKKITKQQSGGLFKILHLGPLLPARQCWILFECPPIIWSIYGYWNYYKYNNTSSTSTTMNNNLNVMIATKIMLCMFFIHYIYRCIIYPLFIMPSTSRGFPAGLLLGTIPYTTINGFLQVQGICKYYPDQYPNQSSPDSSSSLIRFGIGFSIWFIGFITVIIHDSILCSLKKKSNYDSSKSENSSKSPKSHRYKIPYGYLFTYVSCPHFFGEIIEWIGYAIVVNTAFAWSFPIFTLCNLLPRAISQHTWYLHVGFPTIYQNLNRKAIIPFIW